MPRYIDAEKLKDYIKQYWVIPGLMMVSILGNIDIIPTADVQEVRHGKWEYHGRDITHYCSACGEAIPLGYEFLYCPNCGAKMDEKEDSKEEIDDTDSKTAF